jgi:coatomer subunit delta
MNRLRVEGLLAAFPKLMGHAQQSQHTYVETDTVRYVYQPLENQMYLLLITTKASNIVEDLGTLRLLAKVVPDVAGGLQEHSINEHAFDLIFAFDEVLTAGGYKEETTLSSIRTNLLMDSHEEKIYLAMQESKEEQARENMRKQAKTIKERQMAQMRANMMQGGTGAPMGVSGGMEGFGGGGPQAGGGGIFGEPGFNQQENNASPYNDSPYAMPVAAAPQQPSVIAKTGLGLGGAGRVGGAKKDNLLAAMAAEDNLVMGGGGKNPFDISAPVKAQVVPSTPLTILLEEKITVSMTREGSVESCEVKGTLTLTANTEAGTMVQVTVNKSQLPSAFNFATHPKVDKKPYQQDGTLVLKGGTGIPLSRPVAVLRWSYSGEDAAPLTINCWPEDDGTGSITVNIEMELTRKDLVLQDVNILLPLGTSDPPAIENIDGVYKHDANSGMMCWHFDQVDAKNNATASLEFSIAGSNTEAFFPIQIGFRSETLLCPIQVVSVINSSNNTTIPNQMTKSFAPDTYQCA